MDRLSALGSLAALALLAGCASPATGPAPTPLGVAAAADASTFAWSGCAGASVRLDGVTGLYPRAAPAAWGASPDPTFVMRVLLLRCERVSWGAFERGPVFVAQEWRSDIDPPQACRAESDGTSLLESIWFSDGDLARFAASLGMPAREAAFTATPNGSGAQWQWGPPGEEPSSLSLTPAAGFGASEVATEHLLWADGAGVGVLDLRLSSTDSLTPAWGFLRPPTLYGRANASPAFATPRGLDVAGADVAGALQRFGDPSCGQPS